MNGPCLEHCYNEYALYYIIIGIIIGLILCNLGSCKKRNRNKFKIY